MKTLAQLRKEALALFAHGVAPSLVDGEVLVLRGANGAALDSAAADALLAKAVARERVSLTIEMLAYEQGRRDSSGKVVKNSKGIRVRDGAMQAFGRSGKGAPFMRDHLQRDSTARGGTITASSTTKVDEAGHYKVMQTVELVEPAAVERALRGLMSAVSVGIDPADGDVTCTACDAPIFTKCYHFPFDLVAKKDGTSIEVEWEFTNPRLVETSEVPIAAVQAAEIQSVRLAVAQLSGAPMPGVPDLIGVRPEEKPTMNLAALIALLGLAATATLADVNAKLGLAPTASLEDATVAAQARLATATTATAELAVKNAELATISKSVAELQAERRQRDEDAFITGAIGSGRITLGEEPQWRALYAANKDRAVELMKEKAANSATPVGAPRQSAVDPAASATLAVDPNDKPGFITASTVLADRARDAMERLKANRGAALLATKIFGFRVPGHRFTKAELAATAINNDATLKEARVAWDAVFLDSGSFMESPLLQLAYRTNTTRDEEMYKFLTGVPQMEEWKNDRIMSGLMAQSMKVSNKPYQATLKLKNRDIINDNLGLIGPAVEDMRSDARNHPAALVADFLKAAFTTQLGFDGDVFFATTHATGSNKVAAAFSATEFANAIALLRKQKRLDGLRYLDTKPTHLYVGIDNEALAQKILEQETLASGETNMNYRKTELVVVPDFTTEWAVADQSRATRPIVIQDRDPLTTSTIGGRTSDGAPVEDFVGFVYDETWFGVQAAYGVGGWDFRRIVGGKP